METKTRYRPRRAVTHDEQWYRGTAYAIYFQGLSKQTPEDRERKAAVRWFDATYPDKMLCLQGSLGDMWTPSFRQKSRNSSIGYRKGTHDLFLAIARAPYHGLFFEMKGRDKDTLTPEQREMAAVMQREGYLTAHGTMQTFVQTVTTYLGDK